MKKGGEFEALISKWLRALKMRLVTTMEPPVRVLKPIGKGQFIIVFQSKGVLDFAGSVGGRHVEFDAKDSKANRFSFSMVKPHQQLRLRELAEDGAVAGVVLRMRGETANEDRIYGIPADTFINAVDAGDKSWSRQTLFDLVAGEDAIMLAYEKPKLLLDFFHRCANPRYIESREGVLPWQRASRHG